MSDREALIEQLAAHRTIGASPRTELEWLADHGEFRRFVAGEKLTGRGEPADLMIVVLQGHGAVYLNRGAGRRKSMDWGAGDITGALPFSRLRVSTGEALMDVSSEALVLHRQHFGALVRECPTITEHVVHAMLDRVRHFSSTDWQDDKIVSLGRLAAGLAHELNNPASAAERSARLLSEAMGRATDGAMDLARAGLSDAEYDAIAAFRAAGQLACNTDAASAIERADREDDIAEWLAKNGEDAALASTLAEAGFTCNALSGLSQAIPKDKLNVVLRWLSTDFGARTLASDVERAAHRIYELVSSVRRFTYMDRAPVAEPTDLAQMLSDTVAVLAAKARDKDVIVSMEIPQALPAINAFGAELNQVWSNVIENALDAVPSAGHVVVSAEVDQATMIVKVVDDGPGIPSEHLSHIFDPFFTTKPLGQGTGLGLDIARRIVRRHDGQIEVETRPGRTEFRVSLPMQREAAP